MKKQMEKYGILLLCTLVLAAALCFGMGRMETETFFFRLEGPWGQERIDVFDAEDGIQYVFLPAYGSMDQLQPNVGSLHSVTLDGEPLKNGESCEKWELDRTYVLSADGEEKGGLRFVRSGNVATMHIDTGSGTTTWLHEDKNNEESASVRLITAEGEKLYHNEGCTIRGRGNATWTKEKKPYNLTLPREADLLGMGADADWVLLANATDESNLHNRLVFDLAKETGLGWVPESRFVDVYLNAEYMGLYQLTEKVELGPQRLALDEDSGDFLCKVDLDYRWDTLREPFLTEAGRTVEITGPKLLTEEEKADIRSRVQQMEDALLSGEDLSASRTVDLDSWVRRYLLDEIVGNIDSDVASSYFFSEDGKIYAGPVWDYDMTFGNRFRNEFPNAFIAKNEKKSPLLTSVWYSALYENPIFYSRMTELYEAEFLPRIRQLLDGGIEEMAQSIAPATQANSLRWRGMFDRQYVFLDLIPSDWETVESWLSRRTEFLNSAWLAGEGYVTVQYELEPGGSYGAISLKPGQTLQLQYLETLDYQWYNLQAGETFDPSVPIEQDMILTLERPRKGGGAKPAASQAEPASGNSLATQDILALMSLGAMVALMLVMILAGIARGRVRSRRRTGTPV